MIHYLHLGVCECLYVYMSVYIRRMFEGKNQGRIINLIILKDLIKLNHVLIIFIE